jgi:hypothetical protein
MQWKSLAIMIHKGMIPRINGSPLEGPIVSLTVCGTDRMDS